LDHKLGLDLTIYCAKDDQNTYFKSVKRDIQENYSSQKINFIYVHTNVQRDLNKYDFAVCTSKSESGPSVLLEFLAQEIPFLTYKTGEVTDFVEKKLPGFVIDSFVLEDWVKRTELILQKKDKYVFIKVFQEYWDRENFIEKNIYVYKNIINF
jgi:glycosyltransferase involved in cell wall biosynthesis